MKIFAVRRETCDVRSVSWDSYLELYETAVVSTMTYWPEIWGMNQQKRRKLNDTEIKLLMSACSVNR